MLAALEQAFKIRFCKAQHTGTPMRAMLRLSAVLPLFKQGLGFIRAKAHSRFYCGLAGHGDKERFQVFSASLKALTQKIKGVLAAKQGRNTQDAQEIVRQFKAEAESFQTRADLVQAADFAGAQIKA